LSEIPARTGWTDAEIQQTSQILANAKRIRIVAAEPPLLFSATAFEELLKKLAERVEPSQGKSSSTGNSSRGVAHHAGRRLRPEIFRAALDELASQKKLELQGELVKRAGSQISLLPEEARAKDQIEAAFAAAGLAVPSVKEVLAKLTVEPRRSEKLLQSCCEIKPCTA